MIEIKHVAEQRHEGDRLILRPFHEIFDTADLVECGEDHLFDMGGEPCFSSLTLGPYPHLVDESP